MGPAKESAIESGRGSTGGQFMFKCIDGFSCYTDGTASIEHTYRTQRWRWKDGHFSIYWPDDGLNFIHSSAILQGEFEKWVAGQVVT